MPEFNIDTDPGDLPELSRSPRISVKSDNQHSDGVNNTELSAIQQEILALIEQTGREGVGLHDVVKDEEDIGKLMDLQILYSRGLIIEIVNSGGIRYRHSKFAEAQR